MVNSNGRFGPDYYAHHIGDRTGRVRPPADGDDVGELRRCLDRLAIGDRVVWSGDNESRTVPLTVSEIVRSETESEWSLTGPNGGRYSITAGPDPSARPRLWYHDPSGGRMVPNEGRSLRTLFIIAGATSADPNA